MDEKELREVWRKEFDNVYAQAYLAGFIDGALEGAKNMAKELENANGRTPATPGYIA